MLALDLAVVAGVLALGFAGVLAIRIAWRRARSEIHGRENAREDRAANMRRCHFCRQPTDPAVDLYIEPYWYHRTCNRNEGTK